MRYGDRSAAGRGTGPTRRIVLGGALAAAGAALSARGAFAEDAYPSRPIHVIVPFGPGGLADVTVRIAAEESLLDALHHAGFRVPSGCREGVCGSCEITLLAGEPEHRDHIGPPPGRMYCCVSRALSDDLTVDL